MPKDTIKDKLLLKDKLLIPRIGEKLSKDFNSLEVQNGDNVLRLLSLAKSYLFCCFKVGMKPMYSEFYINSSSMRDRKASGNLIRVKDM